MIFFSPQQEDASIYLYSRKPTLVTRFEAGWTGRSSEAGNEAQEVMPHPGERQSGKGGRDEARVRTSKDKSQRITGLANQAAMGG